jgi:hypothetical protein
MKKTLSKLAVLIATTLSLSAVAFEAAAANSLIGGWRNNVAGKNEVATILNDGTYFLVQDSATDAGRMRYGTYTYNETTGAFTTSGIIDTNGTDFSNSKTFLFSDENTFYNPDDNPDTTFSRITSDSNPLIGSWLIVDDTRPKKVVLNLLADGTYFNAVYRAPDATGSPGMERGTYNYNQVTGELDFTSTQIDTNGDRGPANNGILCCPNNLVTFSSYNLVNAFSISENSTSTWTRVAAVPEADTSAMLLMGAGVMGFIARRRKQTAV